MESGDTKHPEQEPEAKQYEPPTVLATYSVEELRRAAAVPTISVS
jgi:hypothetical protein